MYRTAVGLILLGCVPLALTGCGDSSASSGESTYVPRVQGADVEVVTVQKQPLHAEIEFTGNLLPRRATRVMSEIDGVVRDIPQVGATFDVVVDGKHYAEQLSISYGQQVLQGDVLVELDTRDQEVALRIDEAKLKKAQADLAQLRSWERPEQVQRLAAMRNEAKARYDHALLNNSRIEALVQRNATTKTELERSTMEVSTGKALLEASEATLSQAQAGPTDEEVAVQESLIAEAEAEVEQHRREIEKSIIRAPYDGVITAFHVEIGDRVSPSGNPVAELMDLRYLAAEIAVPEAMVGRVHVGDVATVQAAGTDDPVPGLVVAVNDMVDPQSRTFQVRVALDNEDRRFKAGQFATVTLSLGDEESERLAVPNSAIVFVEGEPHVFVLNDGRVKSTPVKVGISSDTLTEILSGLQPGQRVVVDDPTLLNDGMQATVRQGQEAKVATR